MMEKINWKQLRLTNGGPATRVPALVKQLSTPRRVLPGDGGRIDLLEQEADEQRRNAYVDLNQGLVSAGIWSSASAPAAQLLLGVVERDEVGTLRALQLLVDVLCADDRRLTGKAWDGTSDEALATRAVVREGADVLLSRLKSEDPLVRGALGPLLAFLPDTPEAPLVDAWTREQDETVRGSLLLALGHRLDWSKLGALLESVPALGLVDEGFRALVKLAWQPICEPTLLGPALGELLCGERVNGARLSWQGSKLQNTFLALMRREGRRAVMLEAVLAALQAQADWSRCGALSLPILELGGFSGRWSEWEVVPRESLSSEEIRIATIISAKPGLPGVRFGLADARSERLRLYVSAPPGPLDRQVEVEHEGEVLAGPIWSLIYQLGARNDWNKDEIPEFIRQLPPLERTQVLGELVLGVYRTGQFLDTDALSAALQADLDQHAKALAEWCCAWTDQILESYPPEQGTILSIYSDIDHVALRALVAAEVPFKPEWAALVPWGGQGIRQLLESLPRPIVSDGLYRRLHAMYPDPARPEGLEWVLPYMDLVSSAPLAELVVAKLLCKHGVHELGAKHEPQLVRLRELAQSEPTIRGALEKYKALVATPPPWNVEPR